MYIMQDYINEKEIINPKHIESIKFKNESSDRMMGDYSGTYYDEKYSIRITMVSGQEKVLFFRERKEAELEFDKIVLKMYE